MKRHLWRAQISAGNTHKLVTFMILQATMRQHVLISFTSKLPTKPRFVICSHDWCGHGVPRICGGLGSGRAQYPKVCHHKSGDSGLPIGILLAIHRILYLLHRLCSYQRVSGVMGCCSGGWQWYSWSQDLPERRACPWCVEYINYLFKFRVCAPVKDKSLWMIHLV